MEGKSRFYKKYARQLITKSVQDEKMLIKAKELVKAKDERGVNLFWDEQEEQYMRKLLERSDTARPS